MVGEDNKWSVVAVNSTVEADTAGELVWLGALIMVAAGGAHSLILMSDGLPGENHDFHAAGCAAGKKSCRDHR